MRVRLGWAGLGAVCCASAAAAHAEPQGITLAVVPAEIKAVAQDGPRLAWISDAKRCGARVTLLDLRTRRHIPLVSRCAILPAVAIGGSRVLWEQFLGEGNTELDSRALTATEADPRGRTVADIDVVSSDEDWPPPLVAGDGAALVLWTARDAYQGWRGVERIEGGGKAHRLFQANRPLALAAAGSEVAELEDAYSCPCNFAPQWSPDGTRIAWSRGDSVYVMDADGSGVRRVSRTLVDDAQSPGAVTELPRWSPDGTKLAYAYRARADAPPELRVVNVDGSGDRRLCAGGAPRWSPTGQRLSFIRDGDVWTIASDGSAARRLTTDGTDVAAASWSPDGSQLAEARPAGLYVLRADGGGQTRIDPIQTRSGGSVPEWSPSGAQIAFTHAQRLAVVDPDGTGLRDLAEGADPAWSPDGTRLAFDQVDSNGSTRLFVIPVASGAATEVKLPNQGGTPAWSPDGRLLAVGDGVTPSERLRGTAGIYTVATDGTSPTKLIPPAQLEIRNARTGARIHSFVLPGSVYALGFSRTFFAVLDATALKSDTLRVYRTQTGTPVATLPVARNSANDPCGSLCTRLAVSESGIVVFRLRAQLRAFDATTGTVRMIATAQGVPVGLSLDGNRLVWSDSRPRRSVVYSLPLPTRLP